MNDTDLSHRTRIGEKIKELRTEKGLSIRQLADSCGVGYQNLTKIENSKYNVSIDILSKILKSLDAQLNIQKL